MRYNTLLFDADGTLFDFKRSEREAVADTLACHGVTVNENIIDSYSKINDSLWKKLELGEIKKSELKTHRFVLLAEKYGFVYDAEKVAATYAVELSNKSYLLDGALEICQNLSKVCRLYLITNGFKYMQQRRFDQSPLVPFFNGVFISEELGFEKPAVQYFDAVRSGVDAFDDKHTLIIGDSLSSDIRGGINAGIDVCWFNAEHADTPTDMNINYIIGDLNELYDIVK